MSLAAQLIPYLSLIQRSFPAPIRQVLASNCGNFLAEIQTNRKKIAARNLAGLGMKPTKELTKNTIRNWTTCIADQARSLWMKKTELLAMVEDEDGSLRINETLCAGKGAILVTGHLGNYELAGSYLAARGFPVHAVVEEIPGHTQVINRVRKRFGMGVVGYSNIDRMISILRSGRILILLADRDLGQKGVRVRFARDHRKVPPGPALLCLRTGAPLMCGYFVLDDSKRRYRFFMNRPVEIATRGRLKDRTLTVTAAVAGQLVDMIRQFPDQWFCFQDDWVE